MLQMVGGSFGVSREVALSCQVKVLDPTSNSARVFTTGRGGLLQRTATKDPGISQEYVRAFGIEKLMTTPLHLAGRPIGVLHVANPAARLHRRRRRAGGLADAAGRRGAGAGADALQAAPPGQAGGDPLLGRRRRRLGGERDGLPAARDRRRRPGGRGELRGDGPRRRRTGDLAPRPQPAGGRRAGGGEPPARDARLRGRPGKGGRSRLGGLLRAGPPRRPPGRDAGGDADPGRAVRPRGAPGAGPARRPRLRSASPPSATSSSGPSWRACRNASGSPTTCTTTSPRSSSPRS